MEPGRARTALALILLAGILVRAAHLVALASSVFPQIQLAIPGADTGAHWDWSREILAGDWLGRNTFHQYTDWMKEIAPLDTWIRWWGGAEIFYREPAYPYFLAIARAALGLFGAGSSLLAVFALQMLLGLLRPLVLFALGRRLLDARAGLVAAAAGALYGPFVFFEGSLLRDWIPPILDPLLLFAILRAADAGRARPWMLAGLLFGICTLVRSSILLFLPLALLWILVEQREKPLGPLRPCALLLAGLAIGFVPLAARNLAVGAPMLSITNRAPEAIVESNAVDAMPIGMPVPPSMPGILEKAQGSALRAAILTAEQYEGRWSELLSKQWIKLWGAFDPREHSDNLDYEYGRAVSPALRFAPGFALAGLLGAAGLLFFLRHGGAHRLALLYVVSALLAQLVTVVVGRYRLGMVAVLLAAGAAYAVVCWDRLRAPNPRPALAALALLPLLLGAHFGLQPKELRDPAFDKTSRELEYAIAVELRVEQGRFEDALVEVRRFRAWSADRPNLDVQARFLEGFARSAWGESLAAEGKAKEARAQAYAARRAFQVPLQEPTAWFHLGKVFLAIGERAEGEKWLARYLAEDPGGEYAKEARELVEPR
jgi:hypothetical protein